MDFKQLQTFVQVAELGSFTRAASVLQQAQPALSRQVRALEVELRQTLFDRNGRGVTLTPAGTRLLGHGRGILQQVQRALHDLEAQRGAASGVLCIGLPPSLSRSLTAPLVEAFQQQFPKATLSLVEGLSTYSLEWLQQGRIDCAVVYNATPSPSLHLVPVMHERLYLVSARVPGQSNKLVGPAISLRSLAQHDLVMPGRPHALRMRLETALAEAGLKPRIALEVDSVPALLDLVRRQPGGGWHALLSLNALHGTAQEQHFVARPVRLPPLLAEAAAGRAKRVNQAQAPAPPRSAGFLTTSLWLATSALRPRGALLDQACTLLTTLLRARLAA
jgi:LysR family transcriptional regulator, nitrogen assimilation regulatory protein